MATRIIVNLMILIHSNKAYIATGDIPRADSISDLTEDPQVISEPLRTNLNLVRANQIFQLPYWTEKVYLGTVRPVGKHPIKPFVFNLDGICSWLLFRDVVFLSVANDDLGTLERVAFSFGGSDGQSTHLSGRLGPSECTSTIDGTDGPDTATSLEEPLEVDEEILISVQGH